MRVATLALALLVAGCSTTLQLNSAEVSSGGALSGQSGIGGSLQARSVSSLPASILFVLGLITIAADGPAYAPVFPANPLDPNRSIHEQDCTQPLEIGGGNLRCR